MTFIKLGFRSLFRQKRRTLITLIVITFGIGSLLLTMGHTAFIDWGLRESTIHSETGHLQIFNKDYFDKEEDTILQYGLDDFEEIREGLNQMLDVHLVLARIELMGLISNGDKSVAFVGEAVEPEKEKTLRTLFRGTGADFDSLIAAQHETDGVALGQGLAKSLNAKVGDWLTLMTSTTDGALNAVDVQVVDIFTSGMSEYDKRAVRLCLSTAQMLLNTKKVNKLVVTLDQTEKTDRVYREINDWAKEKGYPIVIKKWDELAAYYHQVLRFFNQIVGFISLVLFIIVFFSTSNTVVMSIVERTREIGTLLSVGTSRLQTVIMFTAEGLFIGIIGGVLAVGFALLAGWVINSAGLMMPPPPGATEGYELLIRNQMSTFVQIFLVTVVVTTLSSIFPAFRVTRLKIVDALGHI